MIHFDLETCPACKAELRNDLATEHADRDYPQGSYLTNCPKCRAKIIVNPEPTVDFGVALNPAPCPVEDDGAHNFYTGAMVPWFPMLGRRCSCGALSRRRMRSVFWKCEWLVREIGWVEDYE